MESSGRCGDLHVATYSRPARGDHHREPDGGGDTDHLHRRRASFPGRCAGALSLSVQINLAWSQELCIYMFIWMAKFGAAYGVRTGIHVGVDVLINRLNDRWRKGVILFGLFGGVVFTAIVGTMGAKFVYELMY